jgi:hypothetical protein
MLFKEMIADYYENHMKQIDTLCGQNTELFIIKVALGGLVVSMLATGPKVRGFKPGRGRWILMVIISVARLPSERK